MSEKNTIVKTTNIKAMDGRLILKRVFAYILRYRLWLMVAVFCMVILSTVQVFIAAILEPIINQGVVQQDKTAAQFLPLAMLVLMIFRALFGYASTYLMAKIGRSVIKDMRTDFFHKAVYLPTRYYDEVPSATLVSKFLFDIEQTAVMTTETFTALIKNSFTAIGLLGWMIFLDWRLSLISVIAIPFVAGVTAYASRRFRTASKDIQDSMGDIADSIKESALGHKIIKIYGAHDAQIQEFGRINQDNYNKNMRRARVSAAIIPVTTLCVAPIFAFILYIYLNYLVEGSDSAGKFVSFLGALVMLMSPLKGLAKVNEKLQIGMTAAHSIFQVVDLDGERDEGSKKLQYCAGNITFSNVTFQYRDDSSAILSDVSFVLPQGKRVALVGASGSGKSTIASLLMRFYKPQQGEITLDGIKLEDYVLDNYRSAISLVNQDPILFDNTIRHNIAYGGKDVDEERLQAAMDAAYVSEFVNDLPEGLDTIVGEQGLRLSGGQRQRISIARAFYKNAAIIILDEATSALDVKSESLIQKALDTLMKDKTSIVIAHRLSTIETADHIIVMQEGQIVESGTHQQLLTKGGVYAEFQRVQRFDELEQKTDA